MKYFYGINAKPGGKLLSLLIYLIMASLLFSVLPGAVLGEPTDQDPSGDQAAPAPYKYEVGGLYVYRISFSSSSKSDFSKLFQSLKTTSGQGAPPPMMSFAIKTSLKGELAAAIVGKKEDGFIVLYRVRNARVTFSSDGRKDPDQEKAIRADLGKPFYALVRPDGTITQTWADPSVTATSRTYMKGILAMARVIFPPGPPPYESWDIQEEDPAGQFIARYKEVKKKRKAEADAPVRTFLKKKLRYLTPETRPETSHTVEMPVIIRPKGELKADFDFSRGILKSITGKESQDHTISRKNVGHAYSSINVKYVRTDIIDPALLTIANKHFEELEEAVKPAPLYSRPSREESEKELHKQQLGDDTLETLLADLKKADAAKDPKFNSMPLYLKFKALVYLHPESCAALGQVLKDAKADSLSMQILPTALNTIGNPEAQAALVVAVKAHLQDKDALIPLLTSLATLEKPIMETQATLEEVALKATDEDIYSTAVLSLGAQARRLAAFSPERADRIIQMLLGELKKSKSPKTSKLIVLALGNTGSNNAIQELSKAAADPSADTRSSGVFAMRFIAGDEAESLILKALSSDDEAGVRLSAASALSHREMTKNSFEVQKKAFRKDKDEKVRLALLGNLWKAEGTYPEVRQMVRKAAAADRSKEVRKAAKDIMSRYPKSYFK